MSQQDKPTIAKREDVGEYSVSLKQNKPREWTLCYGEYDDPAWDGPLFDGKVKVIEYSAYQKLEAALKVAVEALEDIAFSRCRFTIGNDRTQRILIAKDALERIKKVIE